MKIAVCIAVLVGVVYGQFGQQSAGHTAVAFMNLKENDLTESFMDDFIDRTLERVQCATRVSSDCRSCLSGARLFQLLRLQSSTLNYASFERAAKLLLCYAKDVETFCADHDDEDDVNVCDRRMSSYLSAGSNSMTASSVQRLLDDITDIYEDRDDDRDEESDDSQDESADSEENDDRDDSSEDSDENDENDVLDATLFSANCVSTDRLLDELGIDEDDEDDMRPVNISASALSALLLVHLVNGDRISESCRTLPTQSDFLNEIYEDLKDERTMNFEEFKELLDDLNIGSARTAALSTRITSPPNTFITNRAGRRRRKRSYKHITNRKLPSGKRRKRATRKTRRRKPEVTMKKIGPNRCFSKDEILVLAKADKYGGVTKARFSQLCPALIQQQTAAVCDGSTDPAYLQETRFKYTTIAILIVCACSFLGASMLLCIGKSSYQTAVVVFLGLAMGSLTAHSLVQLLPHAFGVHATSEGAFFKKRFKIQPSWFGVISFLGVYVVYVIECLVEKVRRSSDKNDQIKPPNNFDPKNASDNTVLESIRQIYHGGLSPTVVIVAINDILYKFASGLAIGVSFGFSPNLGLGTSIAVVIQNAVHELGQTAVLLNAGLNMVQTIVLRGCVALVALIGAYVGASIGTTMPQRWIFALVAGIFLYIALSKIVPSVVTAIQQTNFALKFIIHNIGVLCGAALVIGLSAVEMAYY